MANKTMSDIQLLQTLKGFDKPYFTVDDLAKILDLNKEVLYVTLNKLVKKGVLIRLKRGVYQPAFQGLELEKTANELYYPSYLSFESALSRYSIMSQIPYTLTFATNRPSKKLTLADREVEYRKLKKELFFGYQLENGIYLAEPEKALLDQLYYMSKGLSEGNTNEWVIETLNQQKLQQYAEKYPRQVKKMLNQLQTEEANLKNSSPDFKPDLAF